MYITRMDNKRYTAGLDIPLHNTHVNVIII